MPQRRDRPGRAGPPARRPGVRGDRGLHRQHRQKPPAGVNPWTIAWHTWLREGAVVPETTRWVIDRHRAELADLAVRTKAADAHLGRLTAADPLVQYLLAVKGIGPVTA